MFYVLSLWRIDYRSVTPLDAARVNRTIFHNHLLKNCSLEAISHWEGLVKSWRRPITINHQKQVENRDLDQSQSLHDQWKLQFTPHTAAAYTRSCWHTQLLAHATAAASVPVYESYDAVRSQKGQRESAPDNPETGDTNQSSTRYRKKPRWQFWGGGCQRQKRPISGSSTTTAVPASVHIKWLGLQQTAAAAASCCRWLLLQRVAVLRWRERLSEQTEHRRGRRKKRNFITKYLYYGRQCTHRWESSMKTNRSLHLRSHWYTLSSIITAAWQILTMSHMLQRIELIRTLYTISSIALDKRSSEWVHSILTRRGSNCSACGGIAAEGTSSDTHKKEMTSI